jgi:hypothetical protein
MDVINWKVVPVFIKVAENKHVFNSEMIVPFAEGISPGPNVKLTVEPPEYIGHGGESVRLSCLVGEDRGSYLIRWSRANGRDLPPGAVQTDGILTIFNPSPADSDVYVCTATLRSTGAVAQIQARVTIVSSRWVIKLLATSRAGNLPCSYKPVCVSDAWLHISVKVH